MKKKNGFLAVHKEGFKCLALIAGVSKSILVLGGILSLCQAAYPYLYFVGITQAINAILAANYRGLAFWLSFIVIGQFLLNQLITFLRAKFDYLAIKVDYEVRLLIREATMAVDYENFANPRTMELVNNAEMALRYTGGFNALIDYYRAMLQQLVATSVGIALILRLFLAVETEASLAFNLLFAGGALCLCGLAYYFNFRLTTKAANRTVAVFDSILQDERKLGYYLFKVINKYDIAHSVRIYGMANMITEEYSKLNEGALKKNIRFVKGEQSVLTTNIIFTGIVNVIVYLVSVYKISQGSIPLGNFALYTGALTQLNGAIVTLVTLNKQISKQVNYMGHFTKLMSLNSTKQTGNLHPALGKNNVFEFHDVSFKYPGSEKYVLRNFSAKIGMDKRIALVGKNGAGKSTIVKLLIRLYDPIEGKITFNGVDIKDYDYKEYLGLFSVVFQDFKLHAATVAENIAVSESYRTDDVVHTLRQVGLYDKIMGFEEGLKTKVFTYSEGGVNFSGGELQKLAMARALYRKAPFYVFDEPTSALDPLAEQEIFRSFEELTENEPCMYISHRMSSCRFCSEIIVIDDGNIRERGRHKDLLKNKSLYSELWYAQAQYYITSPADHLVATEMEAQ